MSIYDSKAYACYLKDEEQLKRSASGGVFWGLAQYIINAGGVVFGAAMNESLQVCHRCSETLEELELLRKSKYVQSRIGDSYIQAKAFLEKSRLVLFSGTPCQIAGLQTFLGYEYDNLICVEVICQGVPSQKVFDRYISGFPKGITGYEFRNQESGWEGITGGGMKACYNINSKKKLPIQTTII